MANKTVPDIILAIRQLSNTVRRQVVTDPEVLARANDGVQSLYDLIDGAHGTFFLARYPFTLVGGYGQNAAALPSDFYHAKGLDRFLGDASGPRMSIDQAPSYAERNALSRRSYDLVAGNVEVSPPTSAAGNYELQYIPKCPVLADKLTGTVSYPSVDVVTAGGAVDGTLHNWFFPGAAFDGSEVGKYLYVQGAANAGNNGLFLITSVPGATDLRTAASGGSESFGGGVTAAILTGPLDSFVSGSNLWTFNGLDFTDIPVGSTIVVSGSETSDGTYTVASGGGHLITTTSGPVASEAFAPGVTVQYQPAGTVYSLPDALNDWILFAELDAAVAVIDKQNLDSSAVQGRRAQQEKRIQAAARARRDQPYQVPMRRRRGWGFNGRGFC